MNDELDLLRTVTATIRLLVASLFLIPAGYRLSQLLLSRETPTLPDAGVSLVVFLNDRPIDSDAVIAGATIADAVLLLIGLRVLK